jgi:hypothetical protein
MRDAITNIRKVAQMPIRKEISSILVGTQRRFMNGKFNESSLPRGHGGLSTLSPVKNKELSSWTDHPGGFFLILTGESGYRGVFAPLRQGA